MMETTKHKNETIDTFYGFWKYLGLMGTFLTGVVLLWWGTVILLTEWVDVKEAVGFMSYVLVMPLVSGLVLSWLSFVEFLRIIKEE